LATLISDVSMHPLDCIKTLQQTEEGMGLSMVTAAHLIFTQLGGISGFFKGFLTWGVCDAIGGALKFSTYEFLKRSALRLQHQQGEHFETIPSAERLKAILFGFAGISFVVSSVITVPGELLKQHLQMGHYVGCFDALGSILEAEGPAGLYSGYDGVLLRDVPYTAMELGLYDLFKCLFKSSQRKKSADNYSDDDDNLQTSEQIFFAGMTGGIAGLVTTPLDSVKTKLMIDLDFAGMSFWDAACATIENHGPESLFCGALARVAWLVPVTAIYLPMYDFIKTRIEEQDL
jgi:Mitochondrial carrier protein